MRNFLQPKIRCSLRPSKVVLFSQAPAVYAGGTGGRSVGSWWIEERRRLESGFVAEVSRSMSVMTVGGEDGRSVCGGDCGGGDEPEVEGDSVEA